MVRPEGHWASGAFSALGEQNGKLTCPTVLPSGHHRAVGRGGQAPYQAGLHLSNETDDQSSTFKFC